MNSCIALLEEQPKIERIYPRKKQEKEYPRRYDKSVFEKFNEMKTDTGLQNDYKKWKDGINYKTNRKITIGGKIHRELQQKFMISYSIFPFGNEYGYSTHESVLFEDLNNINPNEYLQETNKINNEIDDENYAIKQYNKLIDSTIEKIIKLKNWNEFIEFEGKRYGLTNEIINNIHIEKNCFGKMIFIREDTIYIIRDRPFCNYSDGEKKYFIYKCDRCNYEHKC